MQLLSEIALGIFILILLPALFFGGLVLLGKVESRLQQPCHGSRAKRYGFLVTKWVFYAAAILILYLVAAT